MPVYAFGSNGSGQLGIDNEEDVSIPTLHTQPFNVAQSRPLRITAGGSHTLVLYESGYLTCTAPRTSILGNKGRNTEVLAQGIKLCSATWEASIYCTLQNRLFACGVGNKGELGLGEATVNAPGASIPLDLPLLEDEDQYIVDIASGVQHSVAVLSNGSVFGWGNGRKGQIGEPAEVVWKPRRVHGIPFLVKRAVCGREFTCLLGDQGEGQCAILGSDKWHIKSDAPQAIPGWRELGASWGNIFVLLDSGKVISWGRNDHGQLAPSGLPKVERLAIGSEHALVLSVKNQVCIWGWGEHGNCGSKTDELGDVEKGTWNIINLPEDERAIIRGIGAGCATTWIWT